MLRISRSDVEKDSLTEFPLAQRFIKLDIRAYMELLGIWDTVNRPQLALINAINNPKYRFVCAALARRLGKTFIANVIAQLITLVPNCNVLIISPNYTLSSISFELQRKFIKKFDLEIVRDNMKDKIIELSNGSTVRMGSLSTVDSTVGVSYNLVLFDEAALGDGKDSFNVSLRPTLDRPNSKAIFISTPRGKNNWFSEFFDRGFSDEYPEWCSIQADYEENPRMSKSDVDEARRIMSHAEFEQEYRASFTVFQGQIYKLPDESVVEYEVGNRVEAFAGLDPGYKDPTAYVIIVYDIDKDRYHIVAEYEASESTTAGHAARMYEMNTKWGVDLVFIDSAAAQFAADLAYNYDIATTKAKKDVLPGIAYVQTLLEKGQLLVDPSCKHTLAMFDQYRWDTGTSKKGVDREKPLHDKYSHMADAVRYALYTYTA